jgi:hypothetical protein
MLYTTPLPDATASLTGRKANNRKLPARRRAFQAADLILGKPCLVEPTTAQAAALCGVSPGYVHAAKRVIISHPELRGDVEEGLQPLRKAAYGKRSASDLLKIWDSCSFDQRCEFCRRADPDQVVDVILRAIGIPYQADGGASPNGPSPNGPFAHSARYGNGQ